MSSIMHRSYAPEHDPARIEELVLASRIGKTLERYPTIWRVRQLLASRVWEPEHDTCVWEDTFGACVGFAYLSRRKREHTTISMDYIILPGICHAEIFAEILAWACTRTQELASQFDARISLDLAIFVDQDLYIQVLQQYNFSLIQDGHDLYMFCPLDKQLPKLSLPWGFTLQLLSSKENLAAYQGLFGFTHVGIEHRLHQFESPEYQHFVMTAPDNTFIAYLECSMWQEEWQHTGRRYGWIDYIGTSDHYQRRGIGHALLLVGLSHLQSWGADTAMLITASFNSTAHRVFKSANFHISEQDLRYIKTFNPA